MADHTRDPGSSAECSSTISEIVDECTIYFVGPRRSGTFAAYLDLAMMDA